MRGRPRPRADEPRRDVRGSTAPARAAETGPSVSRRCARLDRFHTCRRPVRRGSSRQGAMSNGRVEEHWRCMVSRVVEHPSVDDRRAEGKDARERVSLSGHAGWTPAVDRPDPVALLEAQNVTREPDLVPVRHGRMMVSPFTFYRGAAKIIAADLKDTPPWRPCDRPGVDRSQRSSPHTRTWLGRAGAATRLPRGS